MSQLGLGMTSETSQPARRPANRRGGIAVAVAMLAILVVLAVVLVSVVRWATAKPDYTGTGHGKVTVQVKAGDSVTDVADILARADVVRSASAFVDVAGSDPSGGDIRPGTYKLRLQMSAAAALDLILDPASRVSSRVLIPEGLRVDQTLRALAQATRIPLSSLQALVSDPRALG